MHIPVLLKEVIEYLDVQSNRNYVDCTYGLGGHTKAILKKNVPEGKVLGIEIDRELYHKAESSKRLILINDSYRNLQNIVQRYAFRNIAGILFDLGFSLWHVQKSGRGFTFLQDEPLDMRFDIRSHLTAEYILNKQSQQEIENILKNYGEEQFAKRIAKEIVNIRKKEPLKSTFQLVRAIKRVTPHWYHRKKIHFATKTFQALRIAVNEELQNVQSVLPQALEIGMRGARIVTISFHSLEDRIIKQTFRTWEKQGKGKVLTQKPIMPSLKEIRLNPSSRSAKLRAFQKHTPFSL